MRQIYYKKKLNSLNFLIKVVIKLNNYIYKLASKIYYSNFDSKARLYKKHTNYYNKKLPIIE